MNQTAKTVAAPRHPVSGEGFTLQELQWAAWLTTVDAASATPEQLAVLDESTPSARTSPYYLTLLHDVDALRERSRLFNAVMYGQRGLPRAERELSTVAVSCVNGCSYCASVHARLYAQLAKDEDTVQRLFDEGVETQLAPRLRALVDYAVALTETPPAAGAKELAALRLVGLTEFEILDATNAIAMFAWANRLMQTLGEPVYP
jgi:uncharacterized peroxidase-related enzyme